MLKRILLLIGFAVLTTGCFGGSAHTVECEYGAYDLILVVDASEDEIEDVTFEGEDKDITSIETLKGLVKDGWSNDKESMSMEEYLESFMSGFESSAVGNSCKLS